MQSCSETLCFHRTLRGHRLVYEGLADWKQSRSLITAIHHNLKLDYRATFSSIYAILVTIYIVPPIPKSYYIVNILNIRKLCVHFKSYLLKFRRQSECLCCLLAKIRDFLQKWSILCRHFKEGSA